MRSDVIDEAKIMNELCHPFLPYLFEVCTTARPFRIITQFQGMDSKTVTLQRELLSSQNITGTAAWLAICTELLEAVHYLHSDACIIHNDIKADNIQLSNATNTSSSSIAISSLATPLVYHLVLIDLGKAKDKQSGSLYKLTDEEKVTYLTKHSHIAPEVVHGDYKHSVYSDMFSVGQVLVKISDRNHFSALSIPHINKLTSLVQKCRSVRFDTRPTPSQCLKVFELVMQSLLQTRNYSHCYSLSCIHVCYSASHDHN